MDDCRSDSEQSQSVSCKEHTRCVRLYFSRFKKKTSKNIQKKTSKIPKTHQTAPFSSKFFRIDRSHPQKFQKNYRCNFNSLKFLVFRMLTFRHRFCHTKLQKFQKCSVFHEIFFLWVELIHKNIKKIIGATSTLLDF